MTVRPGAAAGRPPTPPPSNRGGLAYNRAKIRSAPKLPAAEIPEGYATLLVQGWDTVQEAQNRQFNESFLMRLEKAQEQARGLDERGGQAVKLQVGSETVQVSPHGATGGFRYVFGNDDFLILVGSPNKDWSVTVRYLAAGLWEHGYDDLQKRIDAMLGGVSHLRSGDWLRVTRADWAMDWYSPALTAEMTSALADQVVSHQETKQKGHGKASAQADPDYESFTFYARRGRLETLTIGSKGSLQVEVYNKALEITEVSGKTWMYEAWGYPAPDHLPHIWRLEVRMAKEWLKPRNIRDPQQLEKHLPALIGDALYNRRLTAARGTDTNRWRWPLHPLWALAIDQAGATEFLPLGRRVTERADVLERQAIYGAAGNLRVAAHLDGGRVDRETVQRLSDKVVELIFTDPLRRQKERRVEERYRFVREAQ